MLVVRKALLLMSSLPLAVYCPDFTVRIEKIVEGSQIWNLQRKIKRAEGPLLNMLLDPLGFRC